MNSYIPPGKVERYLKEAFSFLIRLILIPALVREILCRNKATIISYHNPSPDVFKSHLKYLIRHYKIIDLDSLIAAIRGEMEWERLPKKTLVITMDDGYSCNYNLIPILDEFNVSITIFLRQDGFDLSNRESEKKFLNKEECIELLKHGISFGAHSMTHLRLSKLSDEEACYEINDSKKYLEKELPIQIWHFSYPYGDYGEREIRILKESSQYMSARTTKPGWIDERTSPFELKCMGVGDEVGINKMILDTIGFFPFMRIVRKKYFTIYFDKYKTPLSYITGVLNLRGPIAQHTERQAELIRKYAKGKKRLVEIGVSEGGSAIEALKVMSPNGKMWLIDPYKSIFYPFFSLSQKIAKRAIDKFKDRDVVFLRDYSYNVVKTWNAEIDYLLLDGCHSEEGFMRDWNDWSRFLEDDGVILIQSVQSPIGLETGAGMAIRRLSNDSSFEWEIIDKADATVAIKRREIHR